MTKENYISKPIITFTHKQAIEFITEKLQDEFSSNFDFIVSIQDAPISISNTNSEIPAVSENTSDNPWLVPDEEGWFMHDPEWIGSTPPSYIEANRKVTVILRGFSYESDTGLANSWYWCMDGASGDIVKWKYAD